MARASIKMGGFGQPKTVPAPGPVSTVAPTGAAPKPTRVKNTRDYGKPQPAPTQSPNPFGVADGGSRLGGI